MRTPYAVALLLTMLMAGTYWFTSVGAICRTPIAYRIGDVDPRFNISRDEVRNVLDGAASIWENATGRNLFTYDEEADLVVNFVYDSRQRNLDEAERLKEQLDQKKDINDTLGETYSSLVNEYNERKLTFEDSKAAYERKLNNYNTEVESYNEQGGAPSAVYNQLQKRKDELDTERQKINQMASELNDLGEQINKLGEKGNEIIEEYNESVSTFNDQYGYSEEFTQGDYQGNSINIYQFESRVELELVLAHELGHSLSIGHVENDTAIMYYLMGDQPMEQIGLAAEDLVAFEAVCGDVTPAERLDELRKRFVNWLNY